MCPHTTAIKTTGHTLPTSVDLYALHEWFLTVHIRYPMRSGRSRLRDGDRRRANERRLPNERLRDRVKRLRIFNLLSSTTEHLDISVDPFDAIPDPTRDFLRPILGLRTASGLHVIAKHDSGSYRPLWEAFVSVALRELIKV